MSKLDLSKFKCIKADDKHATLQHPSGHVVTIAIHALEPKHAEVFKAMAKGGDLLESGSKQGISTQGEDVRRAKRLSYDADQSRSEQQMNHAKTEAKGRAEMERHVKPKLAEGGDINHPSKGLDFNAESGDQRTFAYDHGLPCMNPSCKSHGRPHPNCRCYSGSGWNAMAEGGKVEMEGMDKHFCHGKKPHHPDCEYYDEGGGVHWDSYSAPAPSMPNPNYSDKTTPEQDKQRQAQRDAEDAQFRKEHPAPVEEAEGGKIKPKEPPKEETLNYDKLRAEYNAKNGTKVKRQRYAEGDDEVKKNDDWEGSAGHMPKREEAPAVTKQPVAPQPQPEEQPDQSDAPQEAPAPSPTPSAAAPGGIPKDIPGTPDTMSAENPATSTNPMQQFNNELQDRQKAYDTYQDQAHLDLLNEAKAFSHDLANQHITPMTYKQLFANKDTTGKIGTLMALAIGGMGGGMTHSPNVALGMMDNEINRDIKAQETSKNNARNFMQLAQQHVLNQSQAKNLDMEGKIKAQALGMIYANQSAFDDLIRKKDAYPPGSVQRQQYEQMLGFMAPQIDAKIYGISRSAAANMARVNMLNTVSGGGNSGSEAQLQQKIKNLRMMGEDKMADYIESHHMPGYGGQTTAPVNDSDKKRVNDFNILDNQLKDVLNYVDKYNSVKGNIDLKVLGQMAVKAHEAGALYNKTLDGLGMTEGRQDWVGEQIPSNPQTFFKRLAGSREKISEVARNNRMRRDTLLSGPGGLGLPKQPQQNPNEGKVISNKQTGERLKMVNGKWTPFNGK